MGCIIRHLLRATSGTSLPPTSSRCVDVLMGDPHEGRRTMPSVSPNRPEVAEGSRSLAAP